LIDPHARRMNGVDDLFFWIDYIVEFITMFFLGVL